MESRPNSRHLLSRNYVNSIISRWCVVFFFLVFHGQGNLAYEFSKTITLVHPFIFSLIVFIAGLFGIRYGVYYMVRKTVVRKKDVTRIIMWFAGIQIVIQLIYVYDVSLVSLILNFVILIINCFAIKLFFQKSLRSANQSG